MLCLLRDTNIADSVSSHSASKHQQLKPYPSSAPVKPITKLSRQDSDLRMQESKSYALPLGDSTLHRFSAASSLVFLFFLQKDKNEITLCEPQKALPSFTRSCVFVLPPPLPGGSHSLQILVHIFCNPLLLSRHVGRNRTRNYSHLTVVFSVKLQRIIIHKTIPPAVSNYPVFRAYVPYYQMIALCPEAGSFMDMSHQQGSNLQLSDNSVFLPVKLQCDNELLALLATQDRSSEGLFDQAGVTYPKFLCTSGFLLSSRVWRTILGLASFTYTASRIYFAIAPWYGISRSWYYHSSSTSIVVIGK